MTTGNDDLVSGRVFHSHAVFTAFVFQQTIASHSGIAERLISVLKRSSSSIAKTS